MKIRTDGKPAAANQFRIEQFITIFNHITSHRSTFPLINRLSFSNPLVRRSLAEFQSARPRAAPRGCAARGSVY